MVYIDPIEQIQDHLEDIMESGSMEEEVGHSPLDQFIWELLEMVVIDLMVICTQI